MGRGSIPARISRRRLAALGACGAAAAIAAACGAWRNGPDPSEAPESKTSAASVGKTSAGGSASGASASSSHAASPSGGSQATTTAENLLVAFIGDQGDGSGADQVLRLIEREGAAATIHNGDFDYDDDPDAWDARIDAILGASYPYFAIVGNHDVAAWRGPSGYAAKIAARTARVPEMQCAGELGVKATCTFRGLYLVQSCVGTNELRESCAKDSSEQVSFLRSALGSNHSVWSVCNWHKNQRDMQVGTKPDEVGWLAYQECMKAGALIATGHEHSYARTRNLTNLGVRAAGHGAVGRHDALTLAPGKTFVFVSGLGGHSVREFDAELHGADTWWSSYYTKDAWLMNGTPKSGGGTHGALFVRFHVDGDPRKAKAYFKDVNGRLVDSFTLHGE